MANDPPMHIPDQALHSIFARLPGRSLVRFRCVSKHWNSLISDPYLAKSISRRMMLLQFQDVTIVGTFNGIVLLVPLDMSLCTHMILYNPFTQEYNKVPRPPIDFQLSHYIDYNIKPHNVGFGATPDDFKIIRFEEIKFKSKYKRSYACYVFSVKKNSWSKPTCFKPDDFVIWNNIGMFLNGFLYWQASNITFVILALDIKKMILSKIDIPAKCGFSVNNYTGDESEYVSYSNACLGELHGCLCIIHRIYGATFDLWVMKEQGVGNSWSIAHSFTLSFERGCHDNIYIHRDKFFPVRVLDNGRILLTNSLNQVIIYDTSNDSDTRFNVLHVPYSTMSGIEYVQSLVSPSNMCCV